MFRLALFTPLPPSTSGIADHVEEKLGILAREVDELHVFTPDDGVRFPTDGPDYKVNHYRLFEDLHKARPYDALVYHLGNSRHTSPFWPLMARYPGVVALHDLVFHHIRLGHHLQRGTPGNYLDEITFCHDYEGLKGGEISLCGLNEPLTRFRFSMLPLPVRAAKALLVHSHFAADEVHAIRNDVPVHVTHHAFVDPFPELEGLSKAELRRELGVEADAYPLLGCFGWATTSKKLDVMVRAVAWLKEKYPKARGVIVGEPEPGYDLDNLIRVNGGEGLIHTTGRASLRQFIAGLRACDIGFNMRFPTAGETSASLVRMLGFGLPTFVHKYRQFLEYPEGTSFGARLDNEDEDVQEGLSWLLAEPGRLEGIRPEIRAYAAEAFNLERLVKAEAAFFRETAQVPQIPFVGLYNHLTHFLSPAAGLPRYGLESAIAIGEGWELRPCGEAFAETFENLLAAQGFKAEARKLHDKLFTTHI